ncbi:helix-turn-helix transcriptional regulator [Micromonospora sp. WMMD714]|uniref:helix-turn-helix domain-containing protein n=1 Tax=Micromonospora sp. WMMD714 TaxID=3016097 RepID=UPI002499B0D9|nr:helix-turn-helix transcriptional regulator [Micromonospora sp. WMMD714]WFE62846.1 helix-turn-helix transcriptional regulator [Micromonospora sp. WMMD714]
MTELLVDKLRALRDRSGRSLRELQAATYVSDSSLSRYLSGQCVPPWTVVVTLCELADVDSAELRPAWLAARAERHGRPAKNASADLHAALSRDISTISEGVVRAIQSMLELGGPVPDYLVAAQRAAADAARLLNTPPAKGLRWQPMDGST